MDNRLPMTQEQDYKEGPPAFRGESATEIARGVGAVSLLLLLAIYLPILGFVIALFIPLPILLYRSRLGRTNGATVVIISGIISAFMLGSGSFDFLFFGSLMLLGFILGEMIERPVRIEAAVGKTAALTLGLGVFFLFLRGNAAGDGVLAMTTDFVGRTLETTLRIYEEMDISPDALQAVSESLDEIRYVLVRMLPSLAAASILFITWANLLMAMSLLKRRGIPFPDYGPLTRWKVPEPYVWAIIASGILLLIPDRSLKIIGANGLIVMMTVYFFGGIAIVSYYFDRKGYPPMVRIFFFCIIAFWQVALLAVVGLGLFDIWFDFRKLQTKTDAQ